MDDRRTLILGSIGAVIAALCCFTPMLAIALGALGLAAWLAWSDYVLLPALVLCTAVAILAASRLIQRRRRA